MQPPSVELDRLLDAWLSDEAREGVLRWRGSPEARSAASVADEHDRLAGPEVAALMDEIRGRGSVSAADVPLIEAHLGRARSLRILAPLRDSLADAGRLELGDGTTVLSALDDLGLRDDAADRRDLGRDIIGVLAPLVTRLVDGVAAAAELGTSDATADAALADRARGVLDATSGAWDEAHAYLLRPADGRADWTDVAWAFRAHGEGRLLGDRDHLRRFVRLLDGLGLEKDLAARVRVEDTAGALACASRVVAPAPPADVRLGRTPLRHGLAGQLSDVAGLGRAAALALMSPALPSWARHPVDGSVGWALGALFEQLLADRVFVRRLDGPERRKREALRRRIAAMALFEVRALAAATLGRLGAPPGREAVERAAHIIRSALHVRTGEVVAALWTFGPSSPAPRLRGWMAGLSLASTLRDSFDEDWFRNPRSAEPIRSACSRGGLLSAEAWCAELGAAGDGAGRLLDLWR